MPPREGFESVFMRKDGTRFPVLIFEAPLINAHRVQTGWMSAFIDVSEQRRIEELSRASQERLQASARLATVGEMASLLSHELTQPLAAIASYASGSLNLLGPNAKGDQGEVAMAVRRIAEQADRAGQVIRSVHDFVRPARPHARGRRAAGTDRRGAAAGAAAGAQARRDHRGGARRPAARGHVRPHAGRAGVAQPRAQRDAGDGQPRQHRQPRAAASRGACRGGGRVRAPEDARRWLEFSVADLGCGIDEDVAERLFTPFFTTRADGMGLGLSLCRTVVEQHGGALMHEPNRPRGTIFRFTLPST
jgi:two-component system sensor histidine kinase DctS